LQPWTYIVTARLPGQAASSARSILPISILVLIPFLMIILSISIGYGGKNKIRVAFITYAIDKLN
jgi:hypothetical protein